MVHVSFFAKERPECWIPMIVQACLRMGKERIRAHPQAASTISYPPPDTKGKKGSSLVAGLKSRIPLARSYPRDPESSERPCHHKTLLKKQPFFLLILSSGCFFKRGKEEGNVGQPTESLIKPDVCFLLLFLSRAQDEEEGIKFQPARIRKGMNLTGAPVKERFLFYHPVNKKIRLWCTGRKKKMKVRNLTGTHLTYLRAHPKGALVRRNHSRLSAFGNG